MTTSSASFTWKRKRRLLDDSPKAAAFVKLDHPNAPNEDDDPETAGTSFEDVMQFAVKRCHLLEDSTTKAKRLKEEASILAGNERYWEAIRKFDEALSLTPDDGTLYEMKAQALLILNEVFPAVQTAEQAVRAASDWSTAHHTLGRCQLGLGEVKMAVQSLRHALSIDTSPENAELKGDLDWALELERRLDEADAKGIALNANESSAAKESAAANPTDAVVYVRCLR